MLIIKSMHLINLHFWTYLGAGGGGVRGSHARGRRGDEYAPLKLSVCYTIGSAVVICRGRVGQSYRSIFPQHCFLMKPSR